MRKFAAIWKVKLKFKKKKTKTSFSPWYILRRAKEKNHNLSKRYFKLFLKNVLFFLLLYSPLGFIKRVTDLATEKVERIKTLPIDVGRALEVNEYLTESEFLYFFF